MELFTYNIFRELSTKIPASEYQSLEENILKYGCVYPIITWGEVIIDGHKRYAICKKNDIPFTVSQKHFKSFSEAQRWARRHAKCVMQYRNILVTEQQYDKAAEESPSSVSAGERSKPMLAMPPQPVVPQNETLDIKNLTSRDIEKFLHFLGERFGTNCLKGLVFMLFARIVPNQDKDATRQLLQQLYNLHYTPTFTERSHGISQL